MLAGSLPSTGFSTTLVVSVCNTSLCGRIPFAWQLFTTFICQATSDLDSGVEIFPVFSALPSCVATTRQPPLYPRNDSVSAAVSTSSSGVGAAAFQSVGAAAAALSAASSAGGSLQVSLRGARSALKVAACQSDDGKNTTDTTSDDVFTIADSPTTLSLPGRLPRTSGAVVGNMLLVVCVPLISCAIVLAGSQKIRGTAQLVQRVGVVSFAVMWSMLQVPLSAASVTLLMDARWHRDVVSAVTGSFGLAVSALPVAAVVVKYLQLRGDLKGISTPFNGSRRSGHRIAKVWNQWLVRGAARLLHHRSTWRVDGAQPRRSARLDLLVTSLTVQLLDDVNAPHHWAIVADQVVGLLQGVLVGAVSSADMSCVALQAVFWALFVVCALAAVLAVTIRPRSTIADCVFQVLMTCWTASVVLLSAVGGHGSADVVAVIQAVVQLAWCVPCVLWRCRVFLQKVVQKKSSVERSDRIQSSRKRCLNRTPRLCHLRSSSSPDAAFGNSLRPFVNHRNALQSRPHVTPGCSRRALFFTPTFCFSSRKQTSPLIFLKMHGVI